MIMNNEDNIFCFTWKILPPLGFEGILKAKKNIESSGFSVKLKFLFLLAFLGFYTKCLKKLRG